MGAGLSQTEIFAMTNKIRSTLVVATIAATALLLINISSATADNGTGGCEENSDAKLGYCVEADRDNATARLWKTDENQSQGGSPGDNSLTVDDQRALETAEAAPAPEAQRAWPWASCILTAVDKEPNNRIRSDYGCTLAPLPSDTSEEAQDPGQQPTTEEILYSAATVIHADGAGLYKRPLNVSYTNKYIPSIVAVTSPTQTHVINLLGHDITITLTATSYEWSWGDGTPNLVTTSTGSVWQDGMDLNTDPNLIRHYYTPPQGWRSMLDGPYPHEDREITLTTTWSGTATNPFTGETQTINGLVTTTETTGKFPLSHLVINNTDTWEEKQGH